MSQRLGSNMEPPSSPADQLCPNFEKMAVEALSLMGLPVEIRLIIYGYLFGNSDPIKAVINDEGYLSFTDQPQLHLPSVNKQFCAEACPILYRINTFAVTFNDVHRLANMRLRSRICIESLVVLPETPTPTDQAPPNQNMVQPLTVGFPMANVSTQPFQAHQVSRIGRPREVLPLRTIGNTLGGLRNLSVNFSESFSTLIAVFLLSNSLPCSPIRDWPILEVTIHIKPGDPLWSTRRHYTKSMRDRRLSVFSEAWKLGLGYEMPSFKTIRVQGCLDWADCLLIEEYRSSFGDCSFEKEIIQESGGTTNEDSKYKYTWRRVDEDEQQAEAKDAAKDMHRWVPRLSPENYQKVLASF